ncbi:hypothetical protein INR49_005838 [Caranx melampygus]|nr:hypothetical protein INR49_005838 [Caranx melampygus]
MQKHHTHLKLNQIAASCVNSSSADKQQKGSFYINGYTAQLVPNLRKDSKKNSCFELFAPGRRPFQFTASSPQEAREWVDQINFVLRDLNQRFKIQRKDGGRLTLISARPLVFGRRPDTLCCSGRSPAMRRLLHLSERSSLVYSKMGSGPGAARFAGNLSSNLIPFDDDEEEDEEETYDDIEGLTGAPLPPGPGAAPAPQSRKHIGGQESGEEEEEEDEDIYEVLPGMRRKW